MFSFKKLLAVLLLATTTTLSAQTLEWVLLDAGASSGSCTSSTDCAAGRLCYGLTYTPTVSGTATSYTFGFLGECPPGGLPSITAASCTMGDNTDLAQDCGGLGFLFQPSGNDGNLAVTAGTPVVLHQVCFSLAAGTSISFPEDDFSSLTVSINLPGGGGVFETLNYTTFTASTAGCDGSLPVSWQYFEARPAGKQVDLEWATRSETDHDRFEVEWRPASGDFVSLGTVVTPAAANGDGGVYAFRHANPVAGDNFYRLRQVDLDGTYTYSDIRRVRMAAGTGAASTLYPNPTTATTSVRFGATTAPTSVTLTDVSGRELFRINVGPDLSAVELPTTTLPAGLYLVRVGEELHRLVKR